MHVFPDMASSQQKDPIPRQRAHAWSALRTIFTRLVLWIRLTLTMRERHRIVDHRLRELEAVIEYQTCPDILALAASISAFVHKPIEIRPEPFPGEIAGMVVGTKSKYAIRYSILAHPMLQLTAICHELGHVILGDVEVIAGRSSVRRMRYCGDALSEPPKIPADIDLDDGEPDESELLETTLTTSPDACIDAAPVTTDDDYDPIAEAQAERLGALLRKHWEIACPIAESETVPSMSSVLQDHQAWERFQTDYYR